MERKVAVAVERHQLMALISNTLERKVADADHALMNELTTRGMLCILHFDKDVFVYESACAREMARTGDLEMATKLGEARIIEGVDTVAVLRLGDFYYFGFSVMAPSEEGHDRRKGNLQAYRLAAKALRRGEPFYREIAAEALLHELKFGEVVKGGFDFPINLYGSDTEYVGRRGSRRVDVVGDPNYGAALHDDDGNVVRVLLHGLDECKAHYDVLLGRLKPLDEDMAKQIVLRHRPRELKAKTEQAEECTSK